MSGERKALIVANDEYEHQGLRHLLAPAADADALGKVLGDPQIGGFDVEVVHNQPSHVVYGRIEELFAESRRDDVLLLHFSCHGLKSETGELFFAARNTRPNRLGSTAVPADFVQRCMKTSRSRSIVLLLDCCYGGAFSKGVTVRASGDVNVLDSFPVAELGGGRGRAVITASNAMEYAFEADALADDHIRRPSVFTAAVAEGLATGDADRDEDGWVSLNELYDYVFDRVREQNPNQTPSRDVEMQGELYLARSRRRRIRPRPIPADLEAARTAGDMYTRLGAIGELRSRLASDNLEAAVGAYEALADSAHTDIQYVAERAQAALSETAVRPAQSELHFGRVTQGSPSPRRTVELLGPPIARACTAQASHDWIHATVTADEVDISLDTTHAGVLQGSIDVRGPTGEATVAIDVDVVSPLPEPAHPTRASEPSDVKTPEPTPSPAQAVEELASSPVPDRPAINPNSGQPRSPSPDLDSSSPDDTPDATVRVGRGQRIRWSLWALMPVLSFGMLTPVVFIIAASRLRERRLWTIASAYAAVWLALVIPGLATDSGILFALYAILALVVMVHAERLHHRLIGASSPPQ